MKENKLGVYEINHAQYMILCQETEFTPNEQMLFITAIIDFEEAVIKTDTERVPFDCLSEHDFLEALKDYQP